MGPYLTRRLLAAIPTLLLIMLAVVILVRLVPGSAVDIMLSEQGSATPEARQQLEHELGLDKGIFSSYLTFAVRAARGDLGTSLWSDANVSDLIVSKMPVTAELVVSGLLLGTVVGLVAGIAAAVSRGKFVDQIIRVVGIVFLSLPTFAVATAIVILPVLWFHWSPPLVYHGITQDPVAHVGQLAAPVLVLAFSSAASIMRLSRTTFLDVLSGDYVRTARAKGLGPKTVLSRHCLRNALIPVITLVGLQAPLVFSGSVVIEQIFGIPGTGRLLTGALGTRDYPVIQGLTLIAAIFVLAINLTVDILYSVIDPRIRVS